MVSVIVVERKKPQRHKPLLKKTVKIITNFTLAENENKNKAFLRMEFF